MLPSSELYPVTSKCRESWWDWTPWSLAFGTLVPLAVFLPIVAWWRVEGRGVPFFRTLAACVGAYGATDLWTALGLSAGLRKRLRPWVPTNSVGAADRSWLDWGHFLFGGLLLLVPFLYQPMLLLFPMTWLFAAKYLFVPAVAMHYGGMKTTDEAGPVQPARRKRRRRGAAGVLAVVVAGSAFLFGTAGLGQPESTSRSSDVRLVGD